MNITAIVERTTIRRDSAARVLAYWNAKEPTWPAVINIARFSALVEAYNEVLKDLTTE